MSSYRFETLESSAASEALGVLAAAVRDADAGRRVRAARDSRSPDEGLALLGAYVGIADARLRQAILDVVLAVAETEADRRA